MPYFNVKQVLMKQLSEIFPSRYGAIKSELNGNFQIARDKGIWSYDNLLVTIRRKFATSREHREKLYVHTRTNPQCRVQTKWSRGNSEIRASCSRGILTKPACKQAPRRRSATRYNFARNWIPIRHFPIRRYEDDDSFFFSRYFFFLFVFGSPDLTASADNRLERRKCILRRCTLGDRDFITVGRRSISFPGPHWNKVSETLTTVEPPWPPLFGRWSAPPPVTRRLLPGVKSPPDRTLLYGAIRSYFDLDGRDFVRIG